MFAVFFTGNRFCALLQSRYRHYESVMGAEAKAKSVTNNLPIVRVRRSYSFVLSSAVLGGAIHLFYPLPVLQN